MATMEPKEERRQVLLWAAENARSDVVGHAMDEEKKDPEGDVADLLASQPVVPGEQPRGTALHVACRKGHVDIVRLLLLRSAPPEIHDHNGKTPFEVAVAEAPAAKLAAVRGAFEAELFKRAAGGDIPGTEAIAKALIAGGVDVLACDQGGYTPVAWAELFGQTAAAERLQALARGEEPAAAAAPAEPSDNSGVPQSSGGGEEPNGVLPQKAEQQPVEPELAGPRRVQGLLLWPPPQGAVIWGAADGMEHRLGAAASGPAAALPVGRGATLRLLLPPEADPETNVRLIRTFEAVLQGALGTSGTPCPPALAPCLQGAWAGAGDPPSASACVSCRLDPMFPPSPGSMRLTVVPASEGGSAGSIELIGHNKEGLQAAADTLRQLLLYHARLDPAGGKLLVPALVLEDAPSVGEALSTLMDVWRLRGDELRPAVARLRSWRFARIYTPLPRLDSAAQPGERAKLLRLALEARAACQTEGLDLVPVISTAAAQPLVPRDGTATSEASSRFEALAEALSQFQGARLVGLRLLQDDPLEAAVVLTRLMEVQQLLRAAGLGGSAGAGVAVWLPASSPALVAEVCSGVRAGRVWPDSPVRGFAVVLCPGSDGRAVEGVAAACAYGVPSQLFAEAPRLAAEVGPVNGVCSLVPASGPPPFVAPRTGARARAAALARLSTEGRRAGAGGLVVEIPVYGGPWCGAGTRLPEAWCCLTAFLAAGLARDPEGAASSLGATGDGSGELGELLAAQLLGAPAGSKEAAGAALVLFGAPAASKSVSGGVGGPPEPLLLGLLGLLAGQPDVRSGSLEAAVAGANAWFQLLTERKKLLEGCPAQADATVQPWLLASQAGVEWLRFSCRLLMLLAKHAPSCLRGSGEEASPQGLASLRAALRMLPPTKISDMRNSFLSLVERTTGLSGWWSEDETGPTATGPEQARVAEALWQSGLRVGAALDLEPWLGLDVAGGGGGAAPAGRPLVVC